MAVMFFIEPVKIVAIAKSDKIGNPGYWNIGAGQDFSRLFQPEQGKVLNEGFSGTGFEKPAEMLNAQVAVCAHVIDRDALTVMNT
jgi:hypothetical protein